MPYLSDRFHEQNLNGSAVQEPARPNRTGTFDAAAATASIGRRVLGQASAMTAIEHALVIAQAGFQDRERPLGSLLLVGPTGVGKTESVRRLAAELRSGPDDLCRVDMGQLAQEHYAASLSGAPPGYAGSRESSSIFDRSKIEGTPLTPGIVLFDEVEKAHPTVLRALLGVLDHGRLTLASGEQTISFRNAFVFMTSNLGSAEVAVRRGAHWRRMLDSAHRLPRLQDATGRLAQRSSLQDRVAVERAMRKFFEPEFLNRLDGVVHFGEISAETAAEIVELRLGDLSVQFRRRQVELEIDDSVIDALVGVGFDPLTGARSLGRAVREHVLVPVSRALVAHRAASHEGPLRVRLERSRSTAPALLALEPVVEPTGATGVTIWRTSRSPTPASRSR